MYKDIDYVKLSQELKTHTVNDAIRSVPVRLIPPFNLVKFPVAVSNEISVPIVALWFPATPEKLTVGLAINPRLVLIPAYSCKY